MRAVEAIALRRKERRRSNLKSWRLTVNADLDGYRKDEIIALCHSINKRTRGKYLRRMAKRQFARELASILYPSDSFDDRLSRQLAVLDD